MSTTKSRYARPDAPTLARLYTDLGLGCPDIGWLYDRDAKTVHWWLRQAGIQTRARGTNPGPQFKPGQQTRLGIRHTPEAIEKVRAASIARGAVPHLRNGKHWLAGAAPEANPNWKGGATPERQAFYRSPEWKAACTAVWTRDNACCRNCGKDWRTVDRATEPTFHVHHVWSFQIRETRSNPALMVLLCRPCHLWVHSKANTTRAWLPQDSADNLPGLDELNAAYFADQVHYLQAAEREASMPSLFDLEDLKEAA